MTHDAGARRKAPKDSGPTDERSPGSPPPAPLFGVLSLPGGMTSGFFTVTLSYVLGHHGFSVAAIAGLLSLHLLPSTWRFLIGPIVDVSLTPRLWYLISCGLMSAGLVTIALIPLRSDLGGLLGVVAMLGGAAASAAAAAKMAVVALTIPPGRRGAVGGWMQAGNLGGSGFGGGLGLWVATQGGLPLAALVVGAACLACSIPMLWIRTRPRPAGVALAAQALGLAEAMWSLARSRAGVLAMICVVLPVGLGAAKGLMPAVAGEWGAGAKQVALVSGVLSGLAATPGCLAGGYLCARFPPRTVLMATGVICGLGEAAMAWAPHTPQMFTGFMLLNTLLLGLTWGAVTPVILDTLSTRGAATVAACMSSLTNLPVAVVTMVVGVVQTRSGTNAMLLAEAGLAMVGVAAYALLASLWRAEPAPIAATASPA